VTISIAGDEAETYLFADPGLCKFEVQALSPGSPIGDAILGAAMGETVVARLAEGETPVEILGITTDVDLEAGLRTDEDRAKLARLS